jgi:hypothetical protein
VTALLRSYTCHRFTTSLAFAVVASPLAALLPTYVSSFGFKCDFSDDERYTTLTYNHLLWPFLVTLDVGTMI